MKQFTDVLIVKPCNYNPDGNLDNNSCVYAEEGMECGEGCMDESATNFDETASIEGDCCYDCFEEKQIINWFI